MRVELQAAYVLHTRPYRNTSMLVDFLTPDYGRVSGVARGVRGSGKAAKQKRALLQPLTPLLISFSGNSELKSINQFEAERIGLQLSGKKLFSALYLNELLCRLLSQHEDSEVLFMLYQQALQQLQDQALIDVVLRRFELGLLQFLGYGLELTVECETGEAITAGQDYQFYADQGFRLLPANSKEKASGYYFPGSELLSLAAGDFTPEVRRLAKRLCRMALGVHLGAKPLKSRELFS